MTNSKENPFEDKLPLDSDLRANFKYKDGLFRFLFSKNKEYALSLYNALNNSHYTNVDDLEFISLENALKFLDRRLQTIVHSNPFAKSIHQARTLIFQKKIALNKGSRYQIVNIPSYVVRKGNETKILRLNDKEGESRTKKRTKVKKEKAGAEE